MVGWALRFSLGKNSLMETREAVTGQSAAPQLLPTRQHLRFQIGNNKVEAQGGLGECDH